MSARTIVRPFFDDKTSTVSYVVVDNATQCTAIVDPVLDFDFKSGCTSTVHADKLLAHIRDHGLKVPTLILPSVQVNIRAGQLPPAEEDGVSYLKIPLNASGRTTPDDDDK